MHHTDIPIDYHVFGTLSKTQA